MTSAPKRALFLMRLTLTLCLFPTGGGPPPGLARDPARRKGRRTALRPGTLGSARRGFSPRLFPGRARAKGKADAPTGLVCVPFSLLKTG